MKKIMIITLAIASSLSFSAFAYNNGSAGGRALGPEIKCQIKNGDIASMPALYCKILEGKEL
ncbi:hypothetical protein JCM19233_5877 [Vibrio astriarenae]|uniref:Uncharacterized protein n=1 Tax=Vibrio astriarenae TaxID=1481923 RepID=A0A7Z2T1Q3_9VIBR|nr:hypothetical protein [Vibrio astriarenae]QIA62736.1 hypothetical protein GT360_04065 [Vibrio astriarenae]GAL14865.1 hypothetical protein JCM19233_5877 [Vibrio sp. C7]